MGSTKRLFGEFQEAMYNLGLEERYGGFEKAISLFNSPKPLADRGNKKRKQNIQSPEQIKKLLYKVHDSAKSLVKFAVKNGYKVYRVNEWSIVFKKQDKNHGKVTFVMHWKKNSFFQFSVSTTLDHPKKPRQQLQRKHVSIKQVEQLLINPRQHTGKGFYKKR